MSSSARAGSPGRCSQLQYDIADRQVLSKIRGLFGGRMKPAVTGAAPINPEILRFFDAAGVLVVEGWGMTETSTAATIATPDAFKFGTVGRPLPGLRGEDRRRRRDPGQGPERLPGLLQEPRGDAPRRCVDGWLHTGDIGELDPDGYLKITGRKKDIIITAGGKNITPANLEAEIKQQPLVSQCVVIGDRRPYLVALVTLDPEEAAKYAKEHDLPRIPRRRWRPTTGPERDLRPHRRDQPEVRPRRAGEEVQDPARDLSQESGELTPTMKVKRNVVADKYADEIEALYAEAPGTARRSRGCSAGFGVTEATWLGRVRAGCRS